MATIETLRTDVNGLLSEARRSGKAAVTRKLGEAALVDALASPGVAFTVLEAIEADGNRLIASMIPPYRGVWSLDKAGRASAQSALRLALDSYLSDAGGWGRKGEAFDQNRDELIDRDFGPMSERLKGKLESEFHLIDTASRTRSTTGIPIVLIFSIICVLAVIAALVLRVLGRI